MASGKVHDRSITITTPVILTTAIASGHADVAIIATASYYLAGMYLSPDLDLVSRPYKRWGLLRFIWLPYQRLIPRHRHWLSHGPVIGSIVRLAYLATWLSPLLLIPSIHRGLLSIGWEWLIAGFIGVELSAMNHLVLDGLVVPLPKSVKKRLGGN